MDHVFIADTNLFFECMRLEDVPWSELGVDPVVIALTKPVIAEIDKHKTGGGRTRRRALETYQRLRAMIEGDQPETVLRESGPRVVLRLVPNVRPDPAYADVLDYAQNDDRIVGIASALAKDLAFASVSVLTHDTGPASTARGLGLSFRLIPDSWMRPPEETTEAKEIRKLQRDLSTYRAQEPDLALRSASGTATRVVRRVSVPLDEATIDRLVAALRDRHPMQGSFDVPQAETLADGAVIFFEPPDADAIGKYQAETYPGWIASCRTVLETLDEGRVAPEPAVLVTVGLSNRGSRPASRMRVSFEALGSLRLRRSSADADDQEAGEHTRVEAASDARSVLFPCLPAPPKPPAVRRIVRRPPTPPAPNGVAALTAPTAALRLSDLAGAAGALESLAAIRPAFAEIERLVRAAEAFRVPDSMASVMRAVEEQQRLNSALAGGAHLDTAIRDRLYDIPIMRPVPVVRHDSEAIYYEDWPPDVAVARGALTCDLFRHRREEELFACEVVFPEEGNVGGAVLCKVEAENLTEPVALRVPVSRKIERTDLLEAAEALVARCR